MNKTGSWSAKVGLLVAAGVLTAGCTLSHAASSPGAPAGAGPTGAGPAASAPTAGPATGSVPGLPGSNQQTSPAPPQPAASTDPAAAGGAGSSTSSSPFTSTQDLQAETQDQAALDQALTDLQNELNTSDAASNGGENDVPTN